MGKDIFKRTEQILPNVGFPSINPPSVQSSPGSKSPSRRTSQCIDPRAFWMNLPASRWYLQLLEQLYEIEPYQSRPTKFLTACWKTIEHVLDPSVNQSILVDITRTIPNTSYFRQGSVCQDILRRVLEVYAVLDPEVGYVQGLNYVVASLLIHIISRKTQSNHANYAASHDYASASMYDFIDVVESDPELAKECLLNSSANNQETCHLQDEVKRGDRFIISPEQLEEEARLFLMVIHVMFAIDWRRCFIPGFPKLEELTKLLYQTIRCCISPNSKEGAELLETVEYFYANDTLKLLVSDHALTLGWYQIPPSALRFFLTDFFIEREFALIRVLMVRFVMVAQEFKRPIGFGSTRFSSSMVNSGADSVQSYYSPKKGSDPNSTGRNENFMVNIRTKFQETFMDNNRMDNLRRQQSMNLGDCLQMWKTYVPNSYRNHEFRKRMALEGYSRANVVGSENSQMAAIPDAIRKDLYTRQRLRPRVDSEWKRDGILPSVSELEGHYDIGCLDKPWGEAISKFFGDIFIESTQGPFSSADFKSFRVHASMKQLQAAMQLRGPHIDFSSPLASDRDDQGSNGESPQTGGHSPASKKRFLDILSQIITSEPRPPAFVGAASRYNTAIPKSLSSPSSRSTTPNATPLSTSHSPSGLMSQVTTTTRRSLEEGIPNSATKERSETHSSEECSSNGRSAIAPAGSSVMGPMSSDVTDESWRSSFTSSSVAPEATGGVRQKLFEKTRPACPRTNDDVDEYIRFIMWRNHWTQIVLESRRCTFRLENYNALLRKHYLARMKYIEAKMERVIDPEIPNLEPIEFPLPRRLISEDPEACLPLEQFREYFRRAMAVYRREFMRIDQTLGMRVNGDPAKLRPTDTSRSDFETYAKEGGLLRLRPTYHGICETSANHVVSELRRTLIDDLMLPK